MMKTKYLHYILIVLFLLSISCKTINTTLPKPVELSEYTKGMWMACDIKNGSKVAGEIIVIDSSQVLLLSENNLINTVRKNVISKAFVEFSLTTDYPEKLKSADVIPVLTVSHGWFMVITLPLNLAIVVPTVSTHRRGSYAVEYPDKITWQELFKFARFPQGVPEGLEFSQLQSGNF